MPKRSAQPDSNATPYRDAARGPRLQKVLAEAGVGSRRTCEELIEAGQVAVNGHMIDSLPAWVNPAKDRITVGGKRVRTSAPPVYVMLYKPRGVVSTNRDPEGRPRAIDLVDHPSGARLFPVGRLDMDSTGLLLMTNDGELANRLTHPRYHLPKAYIVTVRGALEARELEKLQRGLFLPDRRSGRGKRTTRSTLRVLKRDRDQTRLKLELREGRNRQIRRMMLQLGHPVSKLRRVQMGPLKLGNLRAGSWRELKPDELRALKRAATAAERAVQAGAERRRGKRAGSS